MIKNQKKTALVALSGGVDSSVAALLLKNHGYDVIGLYMKTFREPSLPKGPCKSNAKVSDEKMAKLVAKFLKIKLKTIDSRKSYQAKVINPMINDYAHGLTPNPDIVCNTLIKFPILLKEAKKLKADYIATGHYSRIKKTNKEYYLLQAKDSTKDQSYFLYQLTQKELSKLLLPIGKLTKKEVRAIAKANNLPNWDKPSTRGICFLGKTPGIKSYLEKKIKEKLGRIISPEGRVIGHHPGTAYYTIGEKVQPNHDLFIDKPKEFAQKRYYVAEKRKGNIIVAAPEGHPALKNKLISIKEFHLINQSERPKSSAKLKARIRHLGALHPGELIRVKNKYLFKFSKPLEALASGQSIVLYKGDKIIGGGKISQE